MKMKTDVIGFLAGSVSELGRRDPSRAYALGEIANNLRLLMRGEVSVSDWNEHYAGADAEPLDLDKLIP